MAEDVLTEPLSNNVPIDDDLGNETTVGALRAFNTRIRQGAFRSQLEGLPIPLGPVHYSLDGGITTIDATLTQSPDKLLSLSPAVAATPIQVTDPVAQSDDDITAILALLNSGRSDDLIALLDDQIRIRQADVIRLRRLLYVHQTALQNAIDIVQTKRIDFLEQKKGTWVDGAIGALFLAIIFTLFPVEAIISQALLELSKSAFRVFGAKSVAGFFSAGERLALNEKIAELQSNVKILRGLAKSSGSGRVTSRTNLSPAQTAALQRVGATTVRDPATASGAVSRTEDLIAALKAQRKENAETEKAYRDLLVQSAVPGPADKAISATLSKALENTAFNNAATVKQQADSYASPAKASVIPANGTPIDVALKEQNQGMYASLLFAAEDTIAGLQEFQDACATQTPGQEHLDALKEVLVAEAIDPSAGASSTSAGNNTPTGNGSAQNKIDISAADVQKLVNTGTESFEKLIWIMMYGNQLVKRAKGDSFLEGDAAYVGNPTPDHDHDLLLDYLKTRFYPDKSQLEIGLAYEIIFKTIDKRNEPANDLLDLSCFADGKKILEIIKDARFDKFLLPKGTP